MKQATRENLAYCFTALGSVVFLVWLIPAYTPPYPGYGVPAHFTPNIAVSIILILSILALVRNLVAHLSRKIQLAEDVGCTQTRGPVQWRHLALFMVPCVLVMPAMQLVGFIPAGIAFMLLIQYLCGQRRPVIAVVVAVVTVGVLYAAMRYGLGVPMP